MPAEMLQFIISGQVTKEEAYAGGYPATKRPELERLIREREAQIQAQQQQKELLIKEDNEMWQWAKTRDTVRAYESYLANYDKTEAGAYRGEYVYDARQRMEELLEAGLRLREELFRALQTSPWLFPAETVKYLVDGLDDPDTLRALKQQRDIASRFICTGQTVSFDEVRNSGIVPYDWTLEKILAPDFAVEQSNIEELGDFPSSGRTDVYFLGVPRGGKSSVLAGIFHEMFRRGNGQYVPHFNREGRDPGNRYYNGLIRSVGAAKFPISTAMDTISFMKIDLNNANGTTNPLTFVEIAGEAFRRIAEGLNDGASVWQALGASQCLRSNNRKLLAFIVDYSISRQGVRSDSEVWTDMEQSIVLSNALTVLSSDGVGRDHSEGCTMSKVDTVAVIVTKSDLIGENLSPQDKNQAAMAYLQANFQSFMNNLCNVCRKYGINKPNNFNPYVMTFSLGKLLIGNTYQYDPTDSTNIINFIGAVTAHQRRGGIISNIFKTTPKPKTC